MTSSERLLVILILFLLVFFALFVVKKKQENSFEIKWHDDDWSYHCTFSGRNIFHQSSTSQNCIKRCLSLRKCTHYTWSDGICDLKYGSVNKSNAVRKKDKTAICGIVDRGPLTSLAKFTKCSFSYGRDFSGGGADKSSYHRFDYITVELGRVEPGCNRKRVCTVFNPNYYGMMLNETIALNKVPVFYSHIIAFEGMNDGYNRCGGYSPTLCEKGAKFIRNNHNFLVWKYGIDSKKIAELIGEQTFCVFLIEPGFWHYGAATQVDPLTPQEMRHLFDLIVWQIHKFLPNAAISWDINAELSESDMREWWSFFENSTSIDFIHTYSMDANAESDTIAAGGELTWSFMHKLTGKKIIANSVFVNTMQEIENRLSWYNPAAITQRAAEGVIAITFQGETTPVRTYRRDICNS